LNDTNEKPRNPTQTYYDFFQTTFEAIDMTSSFWQPMLKAVGRAQMEMAGLQARQAQALVRWTHQVMRPMTPFDVFNASIQYWQTTAEQCTQTAPRVAEALGAASVAPIAFKPPTERTHDRLILLDRDERDSAPLRKVA
jgi:hypothetical protein